MHKYLRFLRACSSLCFLHKFSHNRKITSLLSSLLRARSSPQRQRVQCTRILQNCRIAIFAHFSYLAFLLKFSSVFHDRCQIFALNAAE